MKIDEVKRNVFYQFPQWLLEEEYKEMSLRAKIIYMLVFDRRSLSIKNNWHDTNGDVFIYFTNQQLIDLLGCTEKTIISAKKELEEFGLIREERQGISKPNRIYIFAPSKNYSSELEKLQYGTVKNTVQELEKLQTIKTNNINTNYTNTDNINGSIVGGGNTLYSKAKKMSQEPTTTTNELEIFNDLLFENFGSYPSPLQIDDMRYMLEEHSLEVIKLAIKECVDYAKPNMSYMRTVLRNWKKAGLNTPELVKNRVKPRSTRGNVTMLDDGYDPKLGI